MLNFKNKKKLKNIVISFSPSMAELIAEDE